MKKLDRKGFTLVELLAVIVILAIIIALVFPQITNVIDNSKISTIHSNAKSVVSWWGTTISADAMVPEDQWQISNTVKTAVYNSSNVNKWVCIDSVSGFADAAGLSATDYKFNGNPPVGTTVDSGTCSAIKYTSSGELEVLLVAETGGKNYIAGKTTYAFSTATSSESK